MKSMLGMVLLVVGLGLAAASGARNGESHQAWRAELAAGQEATVPEPRTRLSEWFAAGGVGWLAGVALILAGATLARRAHAEAFAGPDRDGDGGTADFAGVVATLQAEVAALRPVVEVLPMDDAATEPRATLDRLRLEVIDPLVDARGALIAQHGIGPFAEYFSPFSGAERQLNRAWSALTDGHVPTAAEALADAEASLAQAAAAYEAVQARLG